MPHHRKDGHEESKKPVAEPVVAPEPTVDLAEGDDDTDESIDPEDFTGEYVSLQSRLYNLRPELFDQSKSGSKKSGRAATKTVTQDSDPQVRRIQAKLSKIENDVLFDRETAEARWRERLNELRKEAAFKRIRERQVEEPLTKASPRQSDPEPEDNLPGDVLEKGGDEELFGDLFAADEAEAAPSTSLSEAQSSHIELRDFGDPTGLSPRRVLEETCRARYVVRRIWSHEADGVSNTGILNAKSKPRICQVQTIRIEKLSKCNGPSRRMRSVPFRWKKSPSNRTHGLYSYRWTKLLLLH